MRRGSQPKHKTISRGLADPQWLADHADQVKSTTLLEDDDACLADDEADPPQQAPIDPQLLDQPQAQEGNNGSAEGGEGWEVFN